MDMDLNNRLTGRRNASEQAYDIFLELAGGRQSRPGGHHSV